VNLRGTRIGGHATSPLTHTYKLSAHCKMLATYKYSITLLVAKETSIEISNDIIFLVGCHLETCLLPHSEAA